MTSHFAKVPLINAAKRQLATQVAVQPQKGVAAASLESKLSTHENGLTLASCDNGSSLATLGLVVKAGSRNETYDNAGIAHALRLAAGLGSKKHTQFGLTRNLAQQGTQLDCALSRETIFYSINLDPESVDNVVDYFLESISGQAFKPWELEAQVPSRMKLDLASISDDAKAEDLLHKAAFRAGLGNSLYAPEYMVGNHKPSLMKAYFNQTFTTQRSALIGVGLSHAQLVKYANMVELEKGQGPIEKAKYYGGGELRHDSGGKKAVVMLATGCGGFESQKEAMAVLLLARVLGSGSRLKWGKGETKLQQAVGDAGTASGISFVHSDASLVGVRVEAAAADAGRAVESAAAYIRSLNVTEAELAAAKKALLIESGESNTSSPKLAHSMAVQISALNALLPLDKIPTMINSCSIGDIQAIAKKLSGGKLSMSAVGNLGSVPYLDAL